MRINKGEVNILKSHPNMYWMLTAISVGSIAWGINFFAFNPTFHIWGIPYELLGAVFLVTSVARLITMNLYRRLFWVRATMAVSMGYMAFLAVGTTQPAFEGEASLQLPIAYALLVGIQIPMMLEPFVNRETAK